MYSGAQDRLSGGRACQIGLFKLLGDTKPTLPFQQDILTERVFCSLRKIISVR
jgi:hypothetical protein